MCVYMLVCARSPHTSCVSVCVCVCCTYTRQRTRPRILRHRTTCGDFCGQNVSGSGGARRGSAWCVCVCVYLFALNNTHKKPPKEYSIMLYRVHSIYYTMYVCVRVCRRYLLAGRLVFVLWYVRAHSLAKSETGLFCTKFRW